MKEYIVPTDDIGSDGSFFGYVELIRCKDCAHWDSEDGLKGYCNGFNLVYRKYDADYYCATAERKPDEH